MPDGSRDSFVGDGYGTQGSAPRFLLTGPRARAWAPLALWLRGLWPDRNPLRRLTDRAEFAVTAVLLAVFLAGAPLVALAAAGWQASAARAGSVGVHQVAAVLLGDAPPAGSLGVPALDPRVPARWPAPGGDRTGLVYALPGAKAGRVIEVWTDRSGGLTGAPAQGYEADLQTAVAAATASLGLFAVLLAIWITARVCLDRRRKAAWDAAWAATSPRWIR
jgi:hypothetical protein